MHSNLTPPIPSLKDENLEKELWENGYVVVPFFDKETVEELIAFYNSVTADYEGKIYASSHSSNIENKRKINEKIKSTYRSKVEELFINPHIMGGTYVVKPAGTGISHPHLDWNLVKEGPYRSCNVWVPLIDLTETNGVIEVLPGSHKLFPTYRGPNIPDRTNDLQSFFWDTMTQLYMKAGEALIYDHRLVHGSGDNLTEQMRPATACAVTNKEAELRLYYLDKDIDKVESFTGNNNEYLLTNVRFEKPTSMTSLGFIEEYELSQLIVSDFDFLNLDYSPPLATATENSETEVSSTMIDNEKKGFLQRLIETFTS